MTAATNTAILILAAMVSSGCVKEQRRISFQQDVKPILDANCRACHSAPDGTGYLQTGFCLASYDDLMKGTFYGPVIVAGDSRHSIFNMLVEGRADPSMRMPHDLSALDSLEIETLRLWVEQGALDN